MIAELGSMSGAGPARAPGHCTALCPCYRTLGTTILFAAHEQHQGPALIPPPPTYPPHRVSSSGVAAAAEAPCYQLNLQAEQQRHPSEQRQDRVAQWWPEVKDELLCQVQPCSKPVAASQLLSSSADLYCTHDAVSAIFCESSNHFFSPGTSIVINLYSHQQCIKAPLYLTSCIPGGICCLFSYDRYPF